MILPTVILSFPTYHRNQCKSRHFCTTWGLELELFHSDLRWSAAMASGADQRRSLGFRKLQRRRFFTPSCGQKIIKRFHSNFQDEMTIGSDGFNPSVWTLRFHLVRCMPRIDDNIWWTCSQKTVVLPAKTSFFKHTSIPRPWEVPKIAPNLKTRVPS